VTQESTTGWVKAYYERVRAAGDQQRIRLPQMASRIGKAYSNNPAQAFVLVDEALTLANSLQEPCWIVIFNWLRVETYLSRLMDLPAAVKTSTEAVVAFRKPEFQNCPALEKLYQSLLTAYIYIDPYGYRDKIRDALDFLEQNFTLDPDTQYDLKIRRMLVALACEEYETAHQIGLEALAMFSEQLDAYLMLAYTEHYRHNLREALTYTQLGEQCKRVPGIKGELDLVQLLGYQAYYLLKLGEADAAEAVRVHAYRLIDRVQSEPFFSFYEAMSGYYEEKGNLERAIALCYTLLESAEKSGSIYGVCGGHVLLCRLLGKNGQSFDAALADAHESFERLIDPTPLLKKLERIENGDYSPD
jgi:tetratricopeptide (TPR) repeat protein